MTQNLDTLLDRMENAATFFASLADELATEVDALEKLPLNEVAVKFFNLKTNYEAVDKQRKRVYALKDRIDKGILPAKFEAADSDKIQVASVARSFYPVTKYSAGIIGTDHREAHKWLQKNGLGALIKPVVSASALAPAFKEMVLNEGIDPPTDLFRFTSYKSIGVSKYTPKKA